MDSIKDNTEKTSEKLLVDYNDHKINETDLLINLYKNNRFILSQYGKMNGFTSADTDDIIQEVFIQFYEQINKNPNFLLNVKSVKQILFYFARRIMMRRKQKSSSKFIPLESGEKLVNDIGMNPLEASSFINLQKLLFENLTSLERKVLAKWQLGFSMDEIAKDLSLADATVARKIKYEAQQKLIKALNKT